MKTLGVTAALLVPCGSLDAPPGQCASRSGDLCVRAPRREREFKPRSGFGEGRTGNGVGSRFEIKPSPNRYMVSKVVTRNTNGGGFSGIMGGNTQWDYEIC
jgi:hypothetical protein